MNYVQKIPVAICGVALGFAALGNLFKTSFESLFLACGILSIALLALYTLKFMVSTKVVLRERLCPEKWCKQAFQVFKRSAVIS